MKRGKTWPPEPPREPPPPGLTPTRRMRRDAMPVETVFKGRAIPILRVEPDLGSKWYFSFVLETLGRNLEVAGGFEYAYRLGLAHDAVKRAGRRR